MAFPSLVPTSRNFNPDARTGMTLELSYDNISDANADLFLTHYNDVKGTYNTFAIPDEVKTGWSGSSGSIDVAGVNAWRYAEPPAVTAVRPGRSSVRVQLIGVL
jgi:hypothetical protein